MGHDAIIAQMEKNGFELTREETSSFEFEAFEIGPEEHSCFEFSGEAKVLRKEASRIVIQTLNPELVLSFQFDAKSVTPEEFADEFNQMRESAIKELGEPNRKEDQLIGWEEGSDFIYYLQNDTETGYYSFDIVIRKSGVSD